jgi:hypothetical protein
MDNDCSGIVNDGLANIADDNVNGECADNTKYCDASVSEYTPSLDNYEPAPEVCDTIDNDCDGATDEGLGQTTCGQGECLHTIDNCVDGVTYSCDPLEGATEEVCDALDNDCDGATDEDALGDPLTQSDQNTSGECSGNIEICDSATGLYEDDPNNYTPVEEFCDAMDNDCNDFIDDDPESDISCIDSDVCTVNETCTDDGTGLCDRPQVTCEEITIPEQIQCFQLCPCEQRDEPAGINHGHYVSCVAHVTNSLRSRGIISGSEKGSIMRTEAKTECAMPKMDRNVIACP